MEKPKHSITLSASALKLLPHPRKEICVKASSLFASKSELLSVLPKNKEVKPYITYLQFVSFTIGHINDNDCLIIPQEGLASYKTIPETPVNIEHNRDEVVGFALKSFLSPLKNNKLLTEEQAAEILDSNGKVNAGVVASIWQINNPELDSLLHENFNPNSRFFESVKASFEYLFDDYDFFLFEDGSDWPDGEIVSGDPDKNPDFKAMTASLLYKKGTGYWGKQRIAIVPKDGFVCANALTFNPANQYSDVLARKDGEETEVIAPSQENAKIEPRESVNSNTTGVIMDKTKEIIVAPAVTPATPAVVAVVPVVEAPQEKVVAAIPLTVDKDVADKLQSALDKKISEMTEKDGKIQELTASITTLQTQFNDAKTAAEKAQKAHDEAIEKLNTLETARAASEQKAKLDSRMDTLSKVVTVDDANRELLTAEASSLSDDDFNKKVAFYTQISNKIVATAETPAPKSVKETVTEVVAAATEVAPKVVVASPPVQAKSLQDEFKDAFGSPTQFGLKV